MLTLVTAPATDPITLAETKGWCRVDFDDDNQTLTNLIRTAVKRLDGPYGLLGRALITQTWELVLDAFPSGIIDVPLPPLQQVVSIKYDDENGDEQTLATSAYTVDIASDPGRIESGDDGWPATLDRIAAVRIRFIAGFGDDVTDLPEPLRTAIMMHVGHLFEHRESVMLGTGFVTEVPQGYDDLIRDYRVWSF
jgi:uncharacterized phiE125 gp8 family phage protein